MAMNNIEQCPVCGGKCGQYDDILLSRIDCENEDCEYGGIGWGVYEHVRDLHNDISIARQIADKHFDINVLGDDHKKAIENNDTELAVSIYDLMVDMEAEVIVLNAKYADAKGYVGKL